MKKILSVLSSLVVTGSLFAGGLVTNTNQSALYIRLQSRNASTEVDAVYYNPAGLTKLAPGFHFGINNQTIGQSRSVMTDYPYLHGHPEREFNGTVSAPFYPSVYAVYNTKRLAFSFGFNPVGGGGGAEYKKGLAMIEMPISDLVPLLAAQGAQDYKIDSLYFKGSSIFFGYQGTVSFKINDMVSIAAGARYVTAKNTYKGDLMGIQLQMGTTWLPASTVFAGIASKLTAFVGVPAATQPLVATFGNNTLAEIPDQYISATQKTDIQSGLALIGVAPAQIPLMTLNQIRGAITTATPVLNGKIAMATATSSLMQDQHADVLQTGSGITPIIGLNLSFTDKLNIGIKYEFKTRLDVTNQTTSDFTLGFDEEGQPETMWPDGAKYVNDMPAMLAVGFELKPIDRLLVTGSMNYYFDKGVDYDQSADLDIKMIDKNFTEYAFGVEYGLTKSLRASAGWLGTYTGVNINYQDEMSYSLNTNSIGAGFGYRITPMVDVNLGGMYTIYQQGEKTYQHAKTGTNPVEYQGVTEKYNKNTWVVAIGVDLHF